MSLTPAFMVLHGNQLENLREVLVQWMAEYPISPLGEEHMLVQSNGIAQWLKMALASTDDGHPGVAAGIRVELPNQFVWRLYRSVLGEDIPVSLPYDKGNLTWRILRLLPDLTGDVFAPLARYLEDDTDGRKRYHLAARLADLYDQYQVYRADWLQRWSQGADVLTRAELNGADFDQELASAAQNAGLEFALPTEQLWQPALWRMLRNDLQGRSQAMAFSSRADVHNKALAKLQAGDMHSIALPERVIVFGISSLPKQTLELLAALGKHTQVVLAVLNPCRHFWGDITTAKDEIRRQQKRQQRKPGLPAVINNEDLYLHAPPLLASLGKQARDYLSLIDEFDEPERYQAWFGDRINVFFNPATGAFVPADGVSLQNQPEQSEPEQSQPEWPLLHQIQHDILELNALPREPRRLGAEDQSISFHRCHSRQREVEVLQDNLLAAFAADSTLRARDIIIMTPDIGDYAPHINAVFGRIHSDDERYLPYSLADQANRGRVPLLIALEYLLSLPEQRVTLNEVFDLLDVPAIQRRLQLQPEVLPQLRLWLTEAGARWGIDAEHRRVFDLAAMGNAFSWAFAIERMLLGYAMGEHGQWRGSLPYAEIGGLSAADLGPVLQFIQQLKHWTQTLAAEPERTFADWQNLLNGNDNLLTTFFDVQDDTDERLYVQLNEALERLSDAVLAGEFDGKLSLAVIRDAWLAEAEQSGLSQKFLAGKITFSTLLPMRAIPFKRIYILGLNDGEYPRSRRPDDFDLMSLNYRAGDRSRRDDDRYLFLEALLSARSALYLSWVGRSDRDNSEKPASVLVNQLRDMIAQGWCAEGGEVLPVLTHEYPLQPFSRAYFNGDFATYAQEWEQTHNWQEQPTIQNNLNTELKTDLPELSLAGLQKFLRNPVRYFMAERFRARDYQDDLVLDDDEPFGLDGLKAYILKNRILQRLLKQNHHNFDQQAMDALNHEIAAIEAEGLLPFAAFGANTKANLRREVQVVMNRVVDDQRDWVPATENIQVSLSTNGHQLVTELDQLYVDKNGEHAFVFARPTAIREKGQPKWHQLIDAWLQQLIANAAGHRLNIWQYGLDSRIVLAAKPQAEAHAQLTAVVECWQQGLARPLPVALKTAFTLLTGGNAEQAYEGDFKFSGELQKSPELARYYGSYAELTAAGLAEWAEALYAPVMASKEATL
ncbi:exodeoxyribonuclease V subunit gamma [Aliidiomarina iranensis]|uniref:RecBCD enzyme subunit RecC n=1 Tax=Aliidiomarina iranensis TaxID=1434071 RepID=A0A432VW53_9GAMM|nr:exodeoxyribonuclease V subunit gamma [Aliidiomarina iranensis]RUO20817.1 exodeoxyribonuclease V subunit gamma [Aliidiomarina iranensis]